MKRCRGCIALVALLFVSKPVFGQAPATPPVSIAGPVNGNLKLPDDTLTYAEAKAYLANFEGERAALEAARKEVLKKGAKATPEERAKLIAGFRTAQKDRIKRIQDMAPRAQDLAIKVRDTDKAAGATPKGGG